MSSVKLPPNSAVSPAPLPRVVSGVGASVQVAKPSSPASNARHAPIADEQSNGRARVLSNRLLALAPGGLKEVFDSSDPEVADHVAWVCQTLTGRSADASPRVPVYRDRLTATAVMGTFLDSPDPLAALRAGISSVDAKATVRRLDAGEFGQEYGAMDRVLYAAVRTGDREIHVAVTDEGMFPRLTDPNSDPAKKQ